MDADDKQRWRALAELIDEGIRECGWDPLGVYGATNHIDVRLLLFVLKAVQERKVVPMARVAALRQALRAFYDECVDERHCYEVPKEGSYELMYDGSLVCRVLEGLEAACGTGGSE